MLCATFYKGNSPGGTRSGVRSGVAVFVPFVHVGIGLAVERATAQVVQAAFQCSGGMGSRQGGEVGFNGVAEVGHLGCLVISMRADSPVCAGLSRLCLTDAYLVRLERKFSTGAVEGCSSLTELRWSANWRSKIVSISELANRLRRSRIIGW